jgi:hypothetical protein
MGLANAKPNLCAANMKDADDFTGIDGTAMVESVESVDHPSGLADVGLMLDSEMTRPLFSATRISIPARTTPERI